MLAIPSDTKPIVRCRAVNHHCRRHYFKGASPDFGAGDLRGDVVAVFAAMLYAAYILALAKMRGRFSTSAIMIWSSGAGALSIVPFARFSEPAQLPSYNGRLDGAVCFVVAQPSGRTELDTYALAWTPATISSLTLLLQPVLAAVLAWLVMGEVLSLGQSIGGSMVLVGILIAHRAQAHKNSRIASFPQALDHQRAPGTALSGAQTRRLI
ncbi:DMT family transporter [Bradyrhizobium sp. 150]|uniref:DMT family transporter n=1 Tax=Bradyrhizobium sp. 150 TaxID=2782625 RepID=UPI002112D039|nr:DMT family transporter [Bradyrhizobium sp. 150]